MAQGFLPRHILLLVILCMIPSLNCDQTCETRDLEAVNLHLRQLRIEFQRFKDSSEKETEELRKNAVELKQEFQMFKDVSKKDIEELRRTATDLKSELRLFKDSNFEDLKSELQLFKNATLGELKTEFQTFKNDTFGELKTEFQGYKNATFEELKTDFQIFKNATEKEIEEQLNTTGELRLEFQTFKDATETEIAELRNNTRELRMEFQTFKNATFGELKTEFEMFKDVTEKEIEEQRNNTEELRPEFQTFKDATETEIAELRNNTRKLGMEFQTFKNASFGELKTDFEMFKDVTEKQIEEQRTNTANSTAGSTYVRWGRTSCPGNGSELVYQGVAGGSYYTHTGAAVNHLCMPLDPTYGEYYEDTVKGGGFVFGAEYQLDNRIDRMNFFPGIDASPDLAQKNVPCAVCHVVREAMIMVPAKTSCMPGWTLEYKGLLVTGYSGHAAASEYICLDDQPEIINGTQANDDGKLLYFVEGRCPSLPCDKYVNGRELTCAVCTK